MRYFIIIISLLIWTNSCRTKSSDGKNTSNDKIGVAAVADIINSPISKRFSAIDSLNKFIATDSFFRDNVHPFYVGRANNKDFGIVQLTDTNCNVYQKVNNAWTITDSFKNSLYNVIATDLNGDGHKDLQIICFVTPAGANSENVVYLFNPKTKRFAHNANYSLPNIQYDKSKNQIQSAWWASANHSQEKMIYKIIGDSLQFDEGVSYSIDKKKNGDLGSLEYYTEHDNKRITVNKQTGPPDKIWTMFSKALWDTSSD